MPYPRAILTMAQNLVMATAEDLYVDEKKFQMLWNAILNFHFPPSLGYGVVPQPSRNGTFSLFKVEHDEESAVLVVSLKEPAEDTPNGREVIAKQLVDLDIRFEGTKFSTMYAICGIGMSYSVYRMDEPFDLLEPELLFDWASNVTAAASFDRMEDLASMIDDMTETRRDL